MELLLRNNMLPHGRSTEIYKTKTDQQVSLPPDGNNSNLGRVALFIYTILCCDHRIMCEYIITAGNRGSHVFSCPAEQSRCICILERLCCVFAACSVAFSEQITE